MGTTASGEENIRKIQRTGQAASSYMVTLPKSYIKKLEWREHQKVSVVIHGNKIVIKDWSK